MSKKKNNIRVHKFKGSNKGSLGVLNHALFFSIVTVIILLDQFIKLYVVTYKPMYEFPFISITLLTNTGAGLGILQGYVNFLIPLSLIGIGLLLWYYPTLIESKLTLVAGAAVIGGAVGNLIDRIRLGHVIDYLKFDLGFTNSVINFADIAITLGIIVLIIATWKSEEF